jgi:hypothetical protein
MDLSNKPRHKRRALPRVRESYEEKLVDTVSRSAAMTILRGDRKTRESSQPSSPADHSVQLARPDAVGLEPDGLLTLLAREISQQATAPALALPFGFKPAANPQELIDRLHYAAAPDPDQEMPDESEYPENLEPGDKKKENNSLPAYLNNAPLKVRRQVSYEENGRRIERYANRAVVLKDQLGRVVDIRSPAGETLSLSLDRDGTVQSFVRRDSAGAVHSTARIEADLVVVRDSEGRVRATGSSMSVDPNGCLFIHNQDGQFLSLDLVRGMHRERRCLAEANGGLRVFTAVFAHDGFRFATCFHDSKASQSEIEKTGGKLSGFRFYGRDGSLVEFPSDDALAELSPCTVYPPGSKCVEAARRRKWQAGTAWDAIKEYLSIIS